jgi:hypothetical protein
MGNSNLKSSCQDCLIWSININHGCGPHNKDIILNKNVVKKLTEILINEQNNIIESVSVDQNLEIKNEGGMIICTDGLKITQNLTNMLKITSNINSTVLTKIKDAVKNAIKNSVDQTNKEITGFLSKEPNGYNLNNIANITESITENILNENMIQNIVAKTQAIQNDIIYNTGVIEGKDCIITQNSLINQFSSAVLNAVSNAALQDKTVNKALNDVTQHLKTKSKGLGSIMSWIVLAIIGVVVVVVIIALVYFSFTMF